MISEDAAPSAQPIEIVIDDRNKGQVAFWAADTETKCFVGGLGSGKTFAGAIEVLAQPAGTRGMVCAPTYPQLRDSAQALFFEIAEQIPGYIVSHNKADNITRTIDGKEILWRSADRPNSLRGPNLHWGWGDEWAFATLEAHLTFCGRQRIGTPRRWFTTTPNGMNWFYRQCTNPALGYEVFHAHTKDNVHNAASYAANLAAQYADDPLFAQQELEGRFVDMGGTRYYSPTLVESVSSQPARLESPQLAPVFDLVDAVRRSFDLPRQKLYLYSRPKPDGRYVLGGDCAEGVRGGDDSTWVVLDVVTGEVVAVLAGEFEPQYEHGAYGAQLSRLFNDAAALPERNNHGHAVIASLRRHGVRVLCGLDGKPGWSTNAASKAEMASRSRAALQAHKTDGRRPLTHGPLSRQITSIERLTLRAPGKGRKSKVDDLWIGWALGECARPLAVKTGRPTVGRRRMGTEQW